MIERRPSFYFSQLAAIPSQTFDRRRRTQASTGERFRSFFPTIFATEIFLERK